MGLPNFLVCWSSFYPEHQCFLAWLSQSNGLSYYTHTLIFPSQKHYLDGHPWESEVIQSFLPTFLIALLALLIPLLLLLIAKKAHTISTLSALHDLIMTRYVPLFDFSARGA